MAWHRSRPTAVDSDASPPAAAHNGMMLLIFSAGLIWRFRIVSTVTILQHAVLSFVGTADGVDRRQEPPREYSASGRRESQAVTCQRVEQTLALFPHLRRGPK